MAREVSVSLWCDVHMALDPPERAPAQTHRVAVDRSGLVELDLCEPCWLSLLKPLADLLAEHGQPSTPERPAAARRSHPCHLCETTLTTAGSLRQHLRTQHNLSIAAAATAGGAEALACPVCAQRFVGRTGMATHLARGHGYDREQRRAAMAPLASSARACPVCQGEFRWPHGMRKHLAAHFPDPTEADRMIASMTQAT